MSIVSHSNQYTETDALERPENYFKLGCKLVGFGVDEAAVKNFVVKRIEKFKPPK